ncbi:hypothetical protein N5094_06975 [Shewanella putrefaciens]|uniref:hypothetical protein n=1 Tax=Shewanella putrefaciens TaxID=24 RepID=UPI0021C12C48|nr:hypothetical protein [Shewanella putrefaciens]UXK09941.1 hypothetical protein N5094_06975 [Shewanella putrefaciens]
MSSLFNKLNPVEIYNYHQRQGLSNAGIDAISWVISQWPNPTLKASNLSAQKPTHILISQPNSREITLQDLQVINKIIRSVPTGKQRHYKRALEAIIVYLKEALKWQTPEIEKLPWPDPDLRWYECITAQANDAFKLQTEYENVKAQFLQQRSALSAEFMALIIALEIAPLTIAHLVNIINDKESIQHIERQTYLNIKHLDKSSNQDDLPQSSRYHLPLFVYQSLTEYQAYSHSKLTEKQLLKGLENLLTSFSISTQVSRHYQHLFQAVWHYRDHVVPTFLKDISYPERHVATPLVSVDNKDQQRQLARIYGIDYDEMAVTAIPKANQASKKWPHLELQNNRNKITECAQDLSHWPVDNILPTMLYRYTLELINFGGVKKQKLADSTIKKYCNIQLKLTSPLSYDQAIDQELLQQWSHNIYDNLATETEQLIMLYFFRFMRHQSLTDHLDISQFEPPLSPPGVDPFRISIEQLHEIVAKLIAPPYGGLLQRLFCAVTVIISYFAMLRRGELLRLRLKDVFVDPANKQLFRFNITNTKEGTTKSKHSRVVYTVIPEEFAILVRIVIKNSELCEPHQHLIGFTDEPYHSRQLQYLLPATKCIKAICGQQARFHHLRHSGVHLFMLQALHLAYNLPPQQTTNTEQMKRLLHDDVLAARFDYWLEGQPFSLCNDGILLDEMTRQIGHEYYATTRWSYLHDIDWLYPFYRPGFGESQPREFSHSELRYLLGLKNDSNDLSRQLALISPDYQAKDINQKRQNHVLLTETALRQHLFKTNKNSVAQKPLSDFHTVSIAQDTVKYHQKWLGNANKISHDFLQYLFLEMRKVKEVNWPLLSQISQSPGKYQFLPMTKAQITALSNLPAIVLSNGIHPALTLTLACNVKNARHFAAVFRQPLWRWLAPSFVLTVNRKTKIDILLNRLKDHFAQSGETITLQKQPVGQSELTITLTPKLSETKLNPHKQHAKLVDLQFVVQQTQLYLSHFQQNN